MKRLRIYFLNPAFLRGIVPNNSLVHLHISQCDVTEGRGFAILGPFLNHNKNLRCLSIRGCFSSHNADYSFGEENIRLLSQAMLECDQCSLKKLDNGCNRFPDRGVSELIEALARMCNLKLLRLDSNQIRRNGCLAIEGLLGSKTCNLEELYLGKNDIDDECVNLLTNALKKNNTVKVLSFGGRNFPPERGDRNAVNPITTTGWKSFSSFLTKPDNRLEKLYLASTNIDDEGATVLSKAFVKSTALKALDISYCMSIGAVGWRAIISNWLQNLNSSLEMLDVSGNNLDDEGVELMAKALATKPSLQTLNMDSIRSITPTGWQAFFGLYPNSQSMLENLSLRFNTLDDDGMAQLTNALAHCSIRELKLIGTNSITTNGWHTFSNYLRSPTSTLEAIFFNTSVNDEVLIEIADALGNNTSLSTLHFDLSSTFTSRAWDSVSTLLCDTSTIQNTYLSNHTIQNIIASGIPDDVDEKLVTNIRCFDDEAAREKILQHHFPRGHDNIQVFCDMDVKVLPQAIAWVGRDELEFWLLYQLVRSVPSLFEHSACMEVAKKKRKVGL